MVWIVNYMVNIKVKNLTGKEVQNIILSHNGEGSNETKIKKLKTNQDKIACLYTLRAKNECDLILTCDYNNVTNTKIIYDKLSSSNKPNITIELNDSNGELAVNAIIKSNLEE